MTNATTFPTDFSAWYSTVDMADGDQDARRSARLSAINTLVPSVKSREDIEALVRIVFRIQRQEAQPEAVQRIRSAFQAADAGFGLHRNDRELQILAASTIVAVMNKDDTTAATAATAVTTAAFAGARAPELPMKLPELAEGAIIRIAHALRRRPVIVPATSSQPQIDIDAAVKHIKDTPNWDGTAAAVNAIGASMQAALARSHQQSVDSLRNVSTFLQIQDEELDMLWWLTGQHSFDLDCSFDEIHQNQRAFVFAKELAALTKRPAGPPSVSALLSRAGLKASKKIPLTTAVDAVEDKWIETVSAIENASPVTTPLHFALLRRRETGAGAAWVAGFAATTAIPENVAVSQLTLATSFYRERLLLSLKAQ